MDPWLERPALWADVHARLIVALADDLGPRLHPYYRVAIEQSTYIAAFEPPEIVGRPDLTVHQATPAARRASEGSGAAPLAEPIGVEVPYREEVQVTAQAAVLGGSFPAPGTARRAWMPEQLQVQHRWLEVRSVPDGIVITIVEILSPINKRPGEGRQEYERKRDKVLASTAHLVEIDLLRDWEPLAFRWPGNGRTSAYRILVSRADRRPRADLYPFGVRDQIPRFPLPLREGDAMPTMDLGMILHGLYDRAGYDLAIQYDLPPEPPLSEEDALWARGLLTA